MSIDGVDHFNPIGKTNYLAIQHLERYRFALEKLKPGMMVLDVAVGSGYGSRILSNYGCKVVGVDFDIKALKSASEYWGIKGTINASALSLPFRNELFDAVVSFETIEHVVEGDLFLSEMKRVLKKEGIFICSTPNIRYTAHPPFHLKEYEPDEFFCKFEQYFSNVNKHGQYFRKKDRLNDLYHWFVFAPLIKLLSKLGVKELVKLLINTIFKRNQSLSSRQETDMSQPISVADDYYSVKPVDSLKWLRIMIGVACKD